MILYVKCAYFFSLGPIKVQNDLTENCPFSTGWKGVENFNDIGCRVNESQNHVSKNCLL